LKSIRRRTWFTPLIAGALIFSAASGAEAASFQVTTTDDSGSGSLRAAMLDANASPGKDSIDVNTDGQISLVAELPHITDPNGLDIIGPGSGLLDVHRATGSGNFRIFVLDDGLNSISGLTVSNGAAIASGVSVGIAGGGIYNQTPLRLDDVVVRDNVVSATASGTNSIAKARGGGIFSTSAFNNLFMKNSIVRDNTVSAVASGTGSSAEAFGGGISSDAVRLEIDRSTFKHNTASASAAVSANGFGGGIYNDCCSVNNAGGGRLFVTDTTFYENHAGGGGAISNAGELAVSNSTISGNIADDFGGGIDNFGAGAITDLNAVTIADNTANFNNGSGDGGGTQSGSPGPGAGISVSNTLYYNNVVYGSLPGSGPVDSQCSGYPSISHGYNLRTSADTGCEDFDPQLGDSVDNTFTLAPLAGSPTLTRALPAGSAPVDAGNPATPGAGNFACPATDQRGLYRGGTAGRCDVGAFELGATSLPPPPPPPPSSTSPSLAQVITGPTGQRAAALKKCKKKKSKKARKKCRRNARKAPL
jgi:hypothetical protein